MPPSHKPPKTYNAFVRRFPELAEAWTLASVGARKGPLDERVRLLVKLAVAIGAQREGAVHSAVRKARAAGIETEALEQVVALAASTLGFPATVAAYTWVGDVTRAKKR